MSRTKKVRSITEFSEVITQDQPEPKYTTKSGIRKAVKIIPRNLHQEEYLEYLLDPLKMIIIANGPAGTGKTVLAMMAGIKALSEKTVHKLILSRPSVGVDDEDLGYLPGDIIEKMSPWSKPLLDVLSEYYSQKDIASMIESQTIEIVPLMYMRGRNIRDAFVVLDESQNCSEKQLKSIFTRLCDGSKLVVTGDNAQSDKKSGENGLQNFKERLEKTGGSQYISSIEFEHADIERHPVVNDVLRIYGDC